MKVLLVKSVTQHFPLGLLYLASELESDGIGVCVLDYVIGRYNPEKFKSEIRKINPSLVGINCLSFDAKPAFDIAKMTKEALPNVHVVMGGPHPTGLPEYTLRNKYVDSVVIGEGEKTLKELVNALGKGYPLKEIRGLVYKDKGEIIFNPPREYIKDPDSILLPAYHLIDLDSYFDFPITPHGMVTRHQRFMSIFTSRGCPYMCTYCHNVFGKSFRARSPENVLSEIELLYNKYSIRELLIEDDSFNLDLARAEKILDLIISKDLKVSIQFPNGLRADILNERFVEKLKMAGTFMVAIGIESGSESILKQVKKRLNLNKIPDAVELLVRKGILVWGYFMIGFLGETRKEMKQTIDFAKRLKINFASFSIVIPFPGTELFEAVKDRINLDSYFYKRLNYNLPGMQLSEVSLEEIKKIKQTALREFYTPFRILRIAKTIHSLKEIKFYWEKFNENILRPRFGKDMDEIINDNNLEKSS